jgi:hypothetical protein
MRKLTKLFSLLAVLAIASPVLAEDPKVTFSGLVDTYFSMNITNMSNDATGTTNGIFYPFNAQDNSYTLGLAELGTTVKAGDATLNLVLAAGEAAEALSFLSAPYDHQWGQIHVMAANLSITKDIWTFGFGKFMTWMGNEVVESKANMNYSRSILFYGIPLYHTGFSVGVAPDSQFAATAYVVDGWNNSGSYDTSSPGGNPDYFVPFAGEKTIGLQLKAMPTDSGFTAILNAIYGPEPSLAGTPIPDMPTLVGEIILSYAVSSQFTVVLDAQMGMQTPGEDTYPGMDAASYIGAALYGKLALEEGWGIALRLEEVIDNGTSLIGGGVANGPSAEYREVTLTVENQLTPNVLARLEGRMDMDLFDGDSTTAYAAGDGNQITATGSMVFSF